MDQTPLTDGSITVGTPAAPGAGAVPAQAQTGTSGATATTGAQPVGQQAAGATAGTAATPPASLFDKFEIPEMVRQNYPELVPLILETESMNDDERQYWFQILPIMTDEQVQKLREILSNEKQQLNAIDQQYNREVKKINEQHVTEWKEFEHKDKRERLNATEAATEAAEKAQEDQLLNQLNTL